MRAVAGLFDTLLRLAGLKLAPWMAPIVLLVLALCLAPLLRRNHRTNMARRRVRRLAYVGAAERERLEAEALALVVDHPAGLLALAQEAVLRGRLGLARRATEAFVAAGGRGPDLAALRRALDPPPSPTPAQERVAIAVLLESGLIDEAQRRLAAARRRWPQEGDWPEFATPLPADLPPAPRTE